MDAGRDRLRAVDRRHHRPARADAGRGHRRCRALRAAGGGSCGRDHRLQRAGLCGVADLSGGGGGGNAACARELRARSGDCRDQPRPGRAAGDRRAARAQRPFCIARQRLGGGVDGCLWLSAVEPIGIFRHRSFSRSRPCWRSSRIREQEIDVAQAHGAVVREVPDTKATSVFASVAPAPAVDLCRQRAAVSARQCGDAAADGRRRHDAVDPVGDGADRSLHHRAAGHCRVDLAFGRAQGAGMGEAAAAAAGVCARSPSAVCCLRP